MATDQHAAAPDEATASGTTDSRFAQDGDLTGARFERVSLRGARFVEADLSDVLMRAVDISGGDVDSPWLSEEGSTLVVYGVDVVPLIEAELNRRYPGRAGRFATDPEGLRRAWDALESTWAAALERVAAMPPGTVHVSVGGEWTFAQTLRHLVMATDTWLGRAVLEIEQPYHPVGQPNEEYALDGYDTSVFSNPEPTYDEVLEARADRQRMVREFLADATPGGLAELRTHPWNPDYRESVLHCLHTILGEEWEHYRFAMRDLDLIAAGRSAT